MAILMIGKRQWPMRKSSCCGMPSSQLWADCCPPKAKATRSNRVGRANCDSASCGIPSRALISLSPLIAKLPAPSFARGQPTPRDGLTRDRQAITATIVQSSF
jgi:hypothetical protein